MMISDYIRETLNTAIKCQCCGQRKFTYRELATQMNQIAGSKVVSEDTVRKFATAGANIRVRQLDVIGRWANSQLEFEEPDEPESESDPSDGS